MLPLSIQFLSRETIEKFHTPNHSDVTISVQIISTVVVLSIQKSYLFGAVKMLCTIHSLNSKLFNVFGIMKIVKGCVKIKGKTFHLVKHIKTVVCKNKS